MRVCPRCRSIYATKVQWCGIDNTALVEQPTDPLVGSELERYRIVESLGVGGMGCVYRASHTFIEREYAIKVLYGDFAGDPKFRERFRREAKSISQIRHPNIVTVEDFGTTPEGLTFLAMEMVHGKTLERAIENEAPFSPIRAAQIIRQVVAGLGAAHQLGFVHRDVKPSNVMISQQDGVELVKVLDFGAVSMRSVPVDQRLTSVGHIIGTPTYMAPEQSQDPTVGPPADLYAAGVMLYEMLTGSPPFVGRGRAEVLIKHIMEEAPKAPPSRGLERIVAALLKKHPEERPQAATEVIRMIDALGLDLAIVSDPPRVLQASMPTAEIVGRRAVIPKQDFHSIGTRAHTPSTDPKRAVDPASAPTPNDDVMGYDTFPALTNDHDPAEWGAWSADGGTNPFDEAVTTARRTMPPNGSRGYEGEFGGPTIPVDTSLDQETGITDPRLVGTPDSADLTPLSGLLDPTDDIRTRPEHDGPTYEEELRPGSPPVAIRDDGPTQVDFSLTPSFRPDLPMIQGSLDTAKTLSDGDIVMRPARTDPANGATMRDTPAPPSETKPAEPVEPAPAPTVELPNLRTGFDYYEDSEESMSVKARVIPLPDSALLPPSDRSRSWMFALIALVLMVGLMIVSALFWIERNNRAEEPTVIIESQ